MRARSHMCRKYLTLLSSTMMYTATFLLKPASSRSLKISTSVNMSMTTAITWGQRRTGWFPSPAMGTAPLLLPRCKSVKNLAPVLLKVDGVGRRAECRKAGDLRAGARSVSQLHVSRPVLRASFPNQVGIH